MPNLNTRIALLLAKLEATEGTDPTPALASDAMQVLEPLEPAYEYAFKHPREKVIAGSSIQAVAPLPPAGAMATWQNTIHARGAKAGTAYATGNRPDVDPWFQSAGYAATIVTTGGAETISYAFAATALKSHYEYYYLDGKLYKLAGVKTDLDFAFDAGGPVVITAKRTGVGAGVTDTALPAWSGTPYGSAVAPIATNVAFLINSSFSAGIIRKWSFNTGNKIAQRENANSATGLAYHKVRERVPKFTVVLEDETVANIDFETLRANRTLIPLSFTIGGTQYNKYTWSAAAAVIEEVKRSDDKGTSIVTLSGGCYDSSPGANDGVTHLFS